MNGEDDRRRAEERRVGAEHSRVRGEVSRQEHEKERQGRMRQRRRVRNGQLLAYLLIIIVAAAGFYVTDRTNDRMCESAKENRIALQNLTLGVHSLGLNLIIEGKPRDKWSTEEEEAVEDLQEFKDEQQELLDKPVC